MLQYIGETDLVVPPFGAIHKLHPEDMTWFRRLYLVEYFNRSRCYTLGFEVIVMSNDRDTWGLKLDHIGKNLFGRDILTLPCIWRYFAEFERLRLCYCRA